MDIDWASDIPSNLYLFELAPIYPAVMRNPVLPVTERKGTINYIVSNCHTEVQRDSFVKMLMHSLGSMDPPIEVHSYGRCLHNTEWPFADDGTQGWGDFAANLNLLLPTYKFEIVAQNSISGDRVDEKLITALKLGVVPVYLGAPNIDEYEPLGRTSPYQAIIRAQDFDNFTHLAEHLHYLDSHDDEYMRYHKWRELLADDAVWPLKWAKQPQWEQLRRMEADPQTGQNRELHYSYLRICEIVKQQRVDLQHVHLAKNLPGEGSWMHYMAKIGKPGFSAEYEEAFPSEAAVA
jgi:hypothetical protein